MDSLLIRSERFFGGVAIDLPKSNLIDKCVAYTGIHPLIGHITCLTRYSVSLVFLKTNSMNELTAFYN